MKKLIYLMHHNRRNGYVVTCQIIVLTRNKMPFNGLPGTVITTQPRYLASGGFAEIWMGKWSNEGMTIMVRAITTFSQSMSDQQAQVAVKMIRGRTSSTTNDLRREDEVSVPQLEALSLFTHSSLEIAAGGKALESAQPS
jgi:hypothetical protein